MRNPVRFRNKATGQYVEPVQPMRAEVVSTPRPSRLVRWAPFTVGPNATNLMTLPSLRAKSREMVRANGYAQAAVDTLVTNVVGTGIVPQFTTPDKELNNTLGAAFLEWTDEADADARVDFYGLQALAVRSMIEGGDVFARMRTRLLSDGLSVPLQIQVLEAEFCDEMRTAPFASSNRVQGGVEFGAIGQRVGYWMYRQHPNDNLNTLGAGPNPPVLVPAADIAHMALIPRPGMIRGEPWLARALQKLHDLEAYDSAQLVRQQIAALFAGFVRRPEAQYEGDEHDLFGAAEVAGGVALAPLQPGTMQHLDDGEEIEFSEPPSPGDSYEAFMRQQLRAVAASVGVLHAQLTGDFSDLNDRTFRAAVNEFRRRCQMWQHQIVVAQFCRPILTRWIELAVLSGRLRLPADITIGMVARAKWCPQGWAYLNPVQDVQARREEVRAGFKSRAQIVSENGDDIEQMDAEMAADNSRADSLGLMLESDPRRTSGSGGSQAKPAGSEFVEPGTAETL